MKTKTKSKLLKTAERIEQQLAESEALFTADSATLYEIDPTKPESIFGLVLIDHGGDVYELLERNTGENWPNPLALTTLGWAAPIDNNHDNLQPSQHPQRRRVSLFITVDQTGQMASVLRFKDTPNETTTDDGEARGALAEALLDLIS